MAQGRVPSPTVSIWNAEKCSREKCFPKNGSRKIGPRKYGPRKIGPRKNGPRKNVLQKLFSIKRMLGNLNAFFIYIDWFHYTHKKMFDVHLTILHAPNCRTLKESRLVCCRVLRFHRLITFEHSTHTPRCSTLIPRFFVSEFSRTIFPGTIFLGTNFPGTIFLGTNVPGTISLGTNFPGTIFPGFTHIR